MNAPLIWVVFPMLCAVLFWFLRRRFGLTIFLATLLGLVLAALAWLLPIAQVVHLGPWTFEIQSTLAFAGRRLVLDNGDRTLLIYLYLICAFWFAGSSAAGSHDLLIPFGLGIITLLVAALAVEPSLYAALLIEMAVLLAVPVLAPPGKLFGQGVLRFVIFQTLAMPFILLAGWALEVVELNEASPLLTTLAPILLGLGFAFWLAVFPFYTWVPLLAEQSYPYVSGFLFLVLPAANLLLGLGYLDRFNWLRASPGLYSVMQLVGVLMVSTAGVWSAFQKDLARLFGYAVIVETGFAVLAVSLNTHAGQQLFASMFLPRMIGFGLWALSLSVLLREARSPRFADVEGLSSCYPFAAAGFAVASLSLAGLPLLGEFPIRLALMEELSRQSLWVGLASLAGSVGMLFSIFRALAVLARGSLIPQTTCETRAQLALLSLGMLGILVIGLLPQVFLPLLKSLLVAYPHLP